MRFLGGAVIPPCRVMVGSIFYAYFAFLGKIYVEKL